jgi:hypothetical protein
MKSILRVDDSRSLGVLAAFILVGGLALVFSACQDSSAPNSHTDRTARHMSKASLASASETDKPVTVEIFAPDNGDEAGVGGLGWFIDIALEFEGNLQSTGFTGNQLTGPGVHNNAPPFPGNFGLGKDDHFGGLVVLLSTTTVGAKSCQNLADAFNLTGPTYVDVEENETEIWDTWIITAALFGSNTKSVVWVAEVADLDHDGIHNDAPSVVPDANHDGRCTGADLRALGLDSDVAAKEFFIN